MSFQSFSDHINDDSFLRIPHKILQFFENDVEKATLFAELLNTYKITESHKRLYNDRFFTSYEILSKKYNLSLSRVRAIMQGFILLELISYKQIGIGSKAKRMYLIHWDKAQDLFYGETSNSRGCTTSKNDKGKDIDNSQSLSEGIKTPSEAPKVACGLVRRRVKEASIFPSSACEEIFNHWNRLGYPLSKHKADKNSITFKKAIAGIQGALKKYPEDVIKKTMRTYHELLVNPDTILTIRGAGNKVPLFEFFKFSPYTEELILKSKYSFNIVSWFDECLKGDEYLTKTYGKFITDPNPKVTERLIETYKELIMDRKFSVSDINCFIRSARLVVKYHLDNTNKINWNSCLPEKANASLFAKRLILAVLEDTKDTMIIAPTWLCSPRTWDVRMPHYLRKHGLLADDKPKTKKKGYDPGYKAGEID